MTDDECQLLFNIKLRAAIDWGEAQGIPLQEIIRILIVTVTKLQRKCFDGEL